MVGWHHRLNRQEFEQTLGDSEGQGSLVCCSLWGLKELRHNIELNNNRKETGALSFSWLCSVLFCEGEVAQSYLTLCDPVDCSLPGFSIYGILQARILEWFTISFSRGSSLSRDRTRSPALEADALTSEPSGKQET